MIKYLDNAATTWPKPEAVLSEISRFFLEVGASPGRSGHRRSLDAARILYNTRESIASLFNAPDPMRIIFTLNTTHGINLILRGLLKTGDHVITSSMEHNSILRPLRQLEQEGIELTVLPCSPEGFLSPGDVAGAVKKNTVLVALIHASNVTGTIMPVKEIGEIAKDKGLLFLLDAAQTAGCFPIDMEELSVDFLCFTGHKALYGPTGTGGFVLGRNVSPDRVSLLFCGGTGSLSEQEVHPQFLPDKFESGTPNICGLAGLRAGVEWIRQRGVGSIREHEQNLTEKLIHGLLEIPGIVIPGPRKAAERTGVVSFGIAGKDPAEIGLKLDEEWGILSRVGLHCAPAAHKTLGTCPNGLVRLSLGAFTTKEDIDYATMAVSNIAKEAGRIE